MSAKRHPKKTTRQKRLIHTLSTTTDESHALDTSSVEGREEAIIRQFHQIQKGYTRLMTDVAKELDLVRRWIGSQAMMKRNDLKARLTARLTRN